MVYEYLRDGRKMTWGDGQLNKALEARLQRAKDRLLKIPIVQLISRAAEGLGITMPRKEPPV
jgi:hypothetical protein